ncbi:hypothetical protein CCAX7_47390 [Capsulimonas corticalis]|uniref:Uncharacterized protein n=1 Tax=Capsulimonas corticalis TaxID=2219043 RepID=A0A402CQI0_9BACT|nr:hypothetical protein [Capsulimonas corticalis]BDI32688.1 hypothetical protein CCAX7_47390 [Capsulimonas corticalis]
MIERSLRPLSLGDIFDEGFDLYKKNLSFLLLIAALIAIPFKVLTSFIDLQILHRVVDLSTMMKGSNDPTQVLNWLGLSSERLSVVAPLYLIVFAVELCVLTAATSARYLGEPVTMRGAYGSVLRRIIPLIVTSILYGVLISVGAVLCVIPVIFPLTLLAMLGHVFTIEKLSYFKALGRSRALVGWDALRVFGSLFLLWLIGSILILAFEMAIRFLVTSIIQALPGAQAMTSGNSVVGGYTVTDHVVSEIGDGLGQLIVTPFIVCVLTVLYYDLRVRREAFDIALLAKDLGYPPLNLRPNAPGHVPAPPPAAPLPQQRGGGVTPPRNVGGNMGGAA